MPGFFDVQHPKSKGAKIGGQEGTKAQQGHTKRINDLIRRIERGEGEYSGVKKKKTKKFWDTLKKNKVEPGLRKRKASVTRCSSSKPVSVKKYTVKSHCRKKPKKK